jgi:predicted nucleic acid-binding protein
MWKSFRASDDSSGWVKSPPRADEAIVDLADLDLHPHPHVDLLGSYVEAADNVSAYDAMYVALAEALEATVVTCDRPMAKAPGRGTRIEVID